MQKQTIPVVGLACSACSANVERKLRSLDGVKEADVSLAGRMALVEFDEAIITLEQMKAAVNDIGYDLIIGQERSVEEIERREYALLLRKTRLSWILAALVMAVTMGWIKTGSVGADRQFAFIIALASILICGRQFYISAWKQLRHGMANMDTLVTLSTAVSFLYAAWLTFVKDVSAHGSLTGAPFDAAVMIITFVLTGRLLEERAKDSMASSIRTLMGLQPKTARLINGGQGIRQVPISTISVGDVIEVRAGEKIPVDGTVTWAESFMTENGAYVDESMITGEPTPVLKQLNAKVLAGTMIQQGSLRFRATQIGEKTALANIVRMVQQAQASKAPVQRIVDRMALVFVPTVVAIAAVTFMIWWMVVGNEGLSQAIVSAVAVLVVACPCAMGLATPTALMVGIGKAAERNILVKDAAALENIRLVNALVIDKTGTLTIPNQDIDFTRANDLPVEMRETLKPHAREAMNALQATGIDVYMMSGDRDDATAYWADRAGIAHYRSHVQPQDKENLVRSLQREGKTVAMVGDGVNDSQALALADVGIAIGTGTDVAMDVAQVTLLGSDLQALVETFTLSRKTVSMIRQNLFWAFVYNIVCIPLAAGLPHAFGIDIQITPMWASALMALSSVSVVLNSLRLKWSSVS